MASEHVTDTPAHISLQDYVRVIRKRWVLIAAMAIVCGATVYAYYKPQKPVYRTVAAVAFQDEARDLGLVGVPAPSFETSAALASTSAQTLTRPEILKRVQKSLATKLTVGQIAATLHPTVEVNSSLLDISVDAQSPAVATQIANGVAQQAVNASNQQTRTRFAQAAKSMSARVRALNRQLPGGGTQLLYIDQLQRLISLSTFAQNAQVAEFAQTPTAPVAPKPLRNAVFGLLVGLMLGIVAAFIADALDRRLRTASEIQDFLDAPLLGQIRAESLGQTVSFDNASRGAANLELETFRILWRNLQFLDVDSPLHRVVITSALPEEGKSTVAASLAAVSAGAGKRVLLVDCDLRRPALAARLELGSVPGVTDHVAGHAPLDEVVQHVPIVDAPSENGATAAAALSQSNGSGAGTGFDFISAGTPSPRSPELLGSVRFSNFVQEMSQRYDLIVFDTSPLLPVADTLELIPHADRLLVCVRAGRTTRTEADAMRKALARFPPRPTGVVVTGITRQDEHDYAAYSYTYAYK